MMIFMIMSLIYINFDGVHGVEFLWLDDPQCSKYANKVDTELEWKKK